MANLIFCPVCQAENLTDSPDPQYVLCLSCGCQSAYDMTARPAHEYPDVEWYGPRWEFGVVAEEVGDCSGKILEIGCGEGYFARCLPSTASYYGVDFNAKAISVASAYFGARGNRFSFSTEMPNITERVEALCMFHVVEHIPQLRDALIDILSRYQPRFIAVSVPNPRRLMVRAGVRESWDYPPHHLYRFTHHGLAELFSSLGYVLSHIESEPLRLDELREVLVGRFRWKKKLVKRFSSLVRRVPSWLLPRVGQATLFIFQQKFD